MDEHVEGHKTERTESGRTQIQDARMLKRAIREGWISGDRFPTRVPRKQLTEEIKQRGDITAIEQATLTAMSLMDHKDPRNKRGGAALVLAMETRNQRDELAQDEEAPAEPSQVDVTVNILQQIKDTAEAVQSNDDYVDRLYREQLREGPGQPGSNGNGHPS